MKKNGRKYRKLQKEKELKKNKKIECKVHICQDVDGINTAYLAMAHIVKYNPILMESVDTKKEYLGRLESYLKSGGWDCRKYEKAELNAYKKIIMDYPESDGLHDISFYRYFILLDFMHVLGYEFKPEDIESLKNVREQYDSDFSGSVDKSIADKIFKTAAKSGRKIKQLLKEPALKAEKKYIELMHKNILFKKKEPAGVMVTATMSAGKSTFINALAGKYICLSQNMACTSKIHCIVNKAFEDGFSSEYDYDLALAAGDEELLNDNELNASDKKVVSTSFIGGLAGRRIIVNDSPGVNFSGNEEHRNITDRLMKEKNYNLLIYVMNATQLGTNDESEHLDYVKKTIGKTPVLFIMNQVDRFDPEKEDLEAVIQRQEQMLRKKGFENPVICPLSAKAGYLAKQYGGYKFSRTTEHEFYNYIDRFEQMRLADYYGRVFKDIKVKDAECEEKQLLKTCGLSYIEKIIIAICKGGSKKDGSGIC